MVSTLWIFTFRPNRGNTVCIPFVSSQVAFSDQLFNYSNRNILSVLVQIRKRSNQSENVLEKMTK